MAETFIPNPDNLPQVLHIDGNKENNSVDNLMCGTNKQNTQQGYDDGAYQFKARSHKVKAVHKETGETQTFKSIRELESVLNYNVTSILKGEKKVNNFDHDFYYDM